MNKLIRSEDLQNLLNGSYEYLTHRIEKKLNEESKNGTPITVLGTFSDHVVAIEGQDRLFHAKYEISGNTLKVEQGTPLQVPLISESEIDPYIEAESGKIVSLLLRGDPIEGQKRLSNLARFVSSAPNKDSMATEEFLRVVHEDRPWKRLFREQSSKIKRFLWGDLMKIESSRVRPQFSRLYNGTMPDDELPAHREEVMKGVSDLQIRVEELINLTEASLSAITGSEKLFTDIDEAELQGVFKSFSSDLLDSLRNVREVLKEATNRLNCVACFGKLHDALAEELTNFVLAGRFVARLASRLREPQQGG